MLADETPTSANNIFLNEFHIQMEKTCVYVCARACVLV